MDKDAPLVSVIVVTLNGANLLRKCLQSLVQQDYPAVEILVVDNGSTEDIQRWVGREFPAVRVLRNAANLGFAGGNNRGLAAARGAYLALINNDAVAAPGWISALVQTAEQDGAIGAVGSVVIDGNAPDVLDSYGVGIALDGMSRQAMKGCPAAAAQTAPADILLPSGCACLLRAAALRETGFFDERFFAYCEDTDLGLRLLRAGWKARAAPAAQVTHFYSMTGGKFSLRKVFWVERNHYWVALKNFPFILIAALPVITLWRHVLQLGLLLRGRSPLGDFVAGAGMTRTLGAILAAMACAAARAPVILMQRCARRQPVRMGSRDFLSLLWRHRLSMYATITGRSACR